jgi:hypothetical protein
MNELEKLKNWVATNREYLRKKSANNVGMHEWDCGYVACLEEVERLLQSKDPVRNELAFNEKGTVICQHIMDDFIYDSYPATYRCKKCGEYYR